MDGETTAIFTKHANFLCYAIGGCVGASITMGFVPPKANEVLTARGNAILRLALGLVFGIFCAPKAHDISKLIPFVGFGDTLNDWLCVGFVCGIGSWFVVGWLIRFFVARQEKDALEVWKEFGKKSDSQTPAVQDSKDGNDPVNQ